MPDDVVGGESAVHPASLTPEISQESSKVGRPPKLEITPELIAKIESYAAYAGLEEIADALGICRDTLNEYKKKYSDISDALKRGKSKKLIAVGNKLFMDAMAGNTTAQIFYLKTQGGSRWRETNTLELQTMKPLIINLTPSGGNRNGHDKSDI